jgi:hypothetical protein
VKGEFRLSDNYTTSLTKNQRLSYISQSPLFEIPISAFVDHFPALAFGIVAVSPAQIAAGVDFPFFSFF